MWLNLPDTVEFAQKLLSESQTKLQGNDEVAEKAHKSRTSLYKALSKQGNPYLKSIREILSSIGLHLSVVAR